MTEGMPAVAMALFFLLLGAIAWILGLWLHARRLKQALEAELEARRQQAAELESAGGELNALKIEQARACERIGNLESELRKSADAIAERDARIEALNRELSEKRAALAELETRLEAERKAAAEKLALLEEAKQKLGNEFKLLANQIFEEKGKVFSEKNRAGIEEVLKPVREQLQDFRKRVDEVHLNDARDRARLSKHLEQLEKLNRQMSEDALNLTQALKGESKAQGNWGEMILERILESSGLREGYEFVREDSTTIAGGKRLRPDVIVRMPGDKHVIIDSKVSLTDYERAISAADDAEKKRFIKAHVASLKKHIRNLAEKRYDQLPGVHSPDYVLMFVPIEGAYMMAIEADQGIFEDAFNRRVAVVTPSTLYATLKLIEQLWRYERQSENVARLIDRAGKLHDKVVDFVNSFEEIGKRLQQAQQAYETAHGRIASGPGNVIRQIDQLGRLSGKAKKELPRHLIEAAAIDDRPASLPEADASSADSAD